MKKIVAISAIVFATLASAPATAGTATTTEAEAARADAKQAFGFVPLFISAVNDNALPGAWSAFKSLVMNPETAIPGKYKELIGLAVSAQIPCNYCTYVHTTFAKLHGATDAEISEAIAIAALTRHWSTVLNGMLPNEMKFWGDIQRTLNHMGKIANKQAKAPVPMDVTDRASALKDIEQHFGFVPDFFADYPGQAIAGAWREFRDVQMNPETSIPGKYKGLIGLAVASQIPCRYCVIFDTQFAKVSGTTTAELNEAIAMSAAIRHWSTILNGSQVDERKFKREIDRIARGAKAKMKKAAAAKKTAHR